MPDKNVSNSERKPGEKIPDMNFEKRTDYVLTAKPTGEDDISSYETFLRVSLTDDQESELTKDIQDELDEALRKRLPLEEEWEINEDQYDGILPEKTYPTADSSNLNVPMTAEKVDAVTAREDKAIIDVTPVWYVEPVESSDLDACKRQEDYLDFSAKNESDYEEEMGNVNFESTLHGTSWLELPWKKETERVKDIEVYKGKSGLEEFMKNYPDAVKQGYQHYITQLEKGEEIELLVEYTDVTYNAPAPTFISIFDMIVDPDALSLKEAHLYGPRFYQTGNDIKKNIKEGYYEDSLKDLEYEKDNESNIATRKRKDFLTDTFTCYRLTVKSAIEDGEMEKKYLVEIIYDTKMNMPCRILKIQNYPYFHNRPMVIPFYISRRKGKGIYRDGLGKVLRDPQEAVNVLFNLNMDAGVYSVVPSFKANRNERANLGRLLEEGLYPGKMYWLDDMNNLEQLTPQRPINIQFLQSLETQVHKYAELRTGVSHYMTGRESPTDPNAPARKTAMLLQEANLRVGSYIKQLQKSNREVAFQWIQLCYQFQPQGKTYRVLGKDGKVTFPKISRKDLRMRADYRPHGSADIFSKAFERDLARENYGVLREDPMLSFQLNPIGHRYLLETYLKTQGGDFEKSVGKLLPEDEELQNFFRTIQMEAMERLQQEKAMEGKVKQYAQQLMQLPQGDKNRPKDKKDLETKLRRQFPEYFKIQDEKQKTLKKQGQTKGAIAA